MTLAARLAALIVALPLAACTPPMPELPALDEKAPDPAAFLRTLGMTMPPATVEFYDYVAWADDSARIVLVMTAADWRAMQAMGPLHNLPPDRWSRANALALPANQGEWRPRDDRAIVAAQVELPRAQVMTIGHSPAAPGRVRVYLFWHER